MGVTRFLNIYKHGSWILLVFCSPVIYFIFGGSVGVYIIFFSFSLFFFGGEGGGLGNFFTITVF